MRIGDARRAGPKPDSFSRRGWDSNPRIGCPITSLAGKPDQPDSGTSPAASDDTPLPGRVARRKADFRCEKHIATAIVDSSSTFPPDWGLRSTPAGLRPIKPGNGDLGRE